MIKILFSRVSILLLGLCLPALAFSSDNISKILIKGNLKIETDAIKAKIQSKPGTRLDNEFIRADIQKIHSMGYFDDVRVFKEKKKTGIVLTYHVKERPVMSSIVYEGTDKVDEDDIKEKVELKEYDVLQETKLKEARKKILELYEEKGFYLARVTYVIKPGKNKNEVKVVFKIEELDSVKVRKIIFLGDKKFADGQLKAIMETRESGLFSFMSGSGSYKENSFDQDVMRLHAWYYNHGYIKVKISKPLVTVTPDKKWIYITISIEAGQQYNVGDITYAGDLLFTREEFDERSQLETGDVFSSEKLQKTIMKYTDMYGDLGYAFTNVIPRHTTDDIKRLVHITFQVEKGNKVHFGRFFISGNDKTHDKVIRRELRIYEGELYNGSRKRISQQRVERLGYFASVVFNTRTPKDRKDVVDIEIQVKERSTGTLTVSAGWGSGTGFMASAQIAQNNLFGRGHVLQLQANISGSASTFQLSFTEPYFLDTSWSLGFDAFITTRKPGFGDYDGYSQNNKGGDVRVGHPIGDYTNLFFTYKLEYITLNEQEFSIPGTKNTYKGKTLNDGVLKPENIEGISSSVITSMVMDKRNNRYQPSDGYYTSLSAEFAGLGGKQKFAKFLLNGRLYLPIIWDFVLRARLEFGYVMPLTRDGLAFNQKFVLGGLWDLRGYGLETIGPRELVPLAGAQAYNWPFIYGGSKKLIATLELEFPLIKEIGIKGVVFFDAGNSFNSWNDTEQPGPFLLTNWGFGFRWWSPIAPLRFEWGFPLASIDRQDGEFWFMIGPSF